MIEEFDIFQEWTYENSINFKRWVSFHNLTYYVKNRQEKTSPEYSVEEFLKKEGRINLANELQIKPEFLIYAFDVWFRTAKYYSIFGKDSIHYFPHKFRRAAITDKIDPVDQKFIQYKDEWSWGRYFVNTMKKYPQYKNLEWLAHNISAVRDETQKNEATWYNLDKKNASPNDKIEILTSIASDSNLPAKLKIETEKSIKKPIKHF